jgi:hypothetical protein
VRVFLVLTVVFIFSAQDSWSQSFSPASSGESKLSTKSPPAPTISVTTAALSRLTVGPDVVIGDAFTPYYGSAVWGGRDLLAWQNGLDGTIWFCTLNTRTGDLIPPDGRGTFVAKGAPYVGQMDLTPKSGKNKFGTYNGPEWGISQEGLGLYLTVVDKNGVYQQAKCLLKDAPKLTVEQLTSGGTDDRIDNLPTQNPNDTMARVGFFQMPSNFSIGNSDNPYPAFWQFDQPGQPQHQIPLETLSYNGPRWIPGEPSVLTFVRATDLTMQVASFNTDTSTLTFLTAGPESHTDAEIVIDPNTGKKCMTAIENNVAIAVYEYASGSWRKTQTIRPNLGSQTTSTLFVFAVKPLLVRGELVFFYNVYAKGQSRDFGTPVDIYVASGNGLINQRVTNGGQFSYCLNPQYYVGEQDNKVFLYYYTSLPLPILDLFSQFRRISFVFE